MFDTRHWTLQLNDINGIVTKKKKNAIVIRSFVCSSVCLLVCLYNCWAFFVARVVLQLHGRRQFCRSFDASDNDYTKCPMWILLFVFILRLNTFRFPFNCIAEFSFVHFLCASCGILILSTNCIFQFPSRSISMAIFLSRCDFYFNSKFNCFSTRHTEIKIDSRFCHFDLFIKWKRLIKWMTWIEQKTW